MNKLDLSEVKNYVSSNIGSFHETRLRLIEEIDLKKILRKKNPYLFKAKNINRPWKLIEAILEAYLSASEEKVFGDFLEDLAVFISSKTCGGNKSSSTGIDFEFMNKGCRYIVSVKSGPNWGNSSQQRKQQEDFQKAIKVLRQSKRVANVQAVLGICYGNTKPNFLRGYWKFVGQSFWYFISGNENLYTDIIEPLGHKAKERNTEFAKKSDALATRLTKEFMAEFCNKDGAINWNRLVKFNSGNLKGDFPLEVD